MSSRRGWRLTRKALKLIRARTSWPVRESPGASAIRISGLNVDTILKRFRCGILVQKKSSLRGHRSFG